ncbi:DUF4270 family protein [Maribellus sediminis]|uniref:DUF4270 family protein n=1 Tax=Maribellus sediminis TaxID=2696285 RepID=UPI0014307473|nr:DUF4270 family protein [Maribellus sediminis]
MHKRFLSFIILVLLFGCTFEDEYVESSIDNFVKSQTRFALLDTFSVELESIQIDSVETSGSGNLLVGKYEDPDLGTVSASAYFDLTLPSDLSIDDKEEYDSLVLVLPYAELVYGDTMQAQNIVASRLLESVVDNDDNPVYNTTTRKYDLTPLGEITIVSRPHKDDTLCIRIDDALGLEFFTKLKDEDDELTDSEDFLDYFKGLALSGGEQNSAILSFLADTSLTLVMHTHISAQMKELKTRTFSLGTSSDYFNHVEADRSELPAQLLKTQREAIPSFATDDKAYIQGGMGVVARINFPTLGRLLEFDTKNMMYMAELILRPYPNSEDVVPLPESLMLYYTDKYNNLISEVTDEDSETVTSELYYDEYYKENNYYSINLTQFIYSELSTGYVDENLGLILTIPDSDIEGTIDRLVIDARSRSDYRPVLKLYYMFFE